MFVGIVCEQKAWTLFLCLASPTQTDVRERNMAVKPSSWTISLEPTC